MVVSGRKLGYIAALGLPLVALLVASCTSSPVTTSTATTLKASISTSVSTASETDTSNTIVFRDTPETEPPTIPASVPALASGITPEQVAQLVADWSHISAEEWEVREYETFRDWAVATVYTNELPDQIDEAGVEVVFRERGGDWFLRDWVSDPSNLAATLENRGAPEEVWRYFTGPRPPQALQTP